MKANELMIGDWVYVSKDFTQKYHKIRALSNDEGAVLRGIYVNEYGIENNSVFSPNDTEPIPLTPEILEKNGFKPYIPEYHIETVYACQDVSNAIADELYALWPYQDGSFYLLLRVDGKDMVRMYVHYIHQLQHALRLCNVSKEIAL